MKNTGNLQGRKKTNVYRMAVIAILSAIAYILMFFEFSIPIMPGFIKMDLSDLPALLGAFAVGPWAGVLIALIKNLLHLTITTTGGVGEMSNFILNALFVLPAGLIYRYKKTKKSAVVGAVVGAVVMAVAGVFTNYLIVYPIYYRIMIPEEVILAAYQAILPGMETIFQSLVVFNLPFNFVKCMISVVIVCLIYNRLIPIFRMSRQKMDEHR
ncbi:MAG: ECF transporter S component [Eubacterium sp.]|nr:ECF transporter S component [Eubacterium sp.]